MNHKSLPEQIGEDLLNLDGDSVAELITRALDQNVDLTIVVTDDLTVGLRKLCEGVENGEVFIPELMWGHTSFNKAWRS